MSGWKYAFGLSKQEVANFVPPGTVKLMTLRNSPDDGVDADQTIANKTIRLIPAPSNNPKDPLNMSMARKIVVLVATSLFAFVSNFTSASISPVLPLLATGFDKPVPFSQLTHLVAANVICLGCSNIFWVPLSNTYGRRFVLVISCLILTLATMGCGLCNNFYSLLAVRVIQGVGGGTADTISPVVIGEVFFLHQRGRAMAIYTALLSLGSAIGSVGGSFIASSLGWRSIFWIGTIISGINFFLFLFGVPETSFDQKSELALESRLTQDVDLDEEGKGASTLVEEPRRAQLSQEPDVQPRHTIFAYIWSLGFRTNNRDLVHQFMRPWKALRIPATWLLMLLYGGLMGGTVAMSTVGPQLVAARPYKWGQAVGLVNLGGVIGIILGSLFIYGFVDYILKRQASTHRGFVEPEARIPILIPSLFIATGGVLVFGFCAANPSPRGWIGLEFGLGMIYFTIIQIPAVGFSYVIDSYRSLSGECFLMATVFRASFAFSLTFFVGSWIERSGPVEPFGIFAMLLGVFSLLTVPIWLWGKRMRIATMKYIEEA